MYPRKRNITLAKVVLLGDSGVGKTSIVVQLAQQMFREEIEPTVGASYIIKEIETNKGPFKLNIWDTAGQERYRSVAPMYLRGSKAALIVFSQQSKDSLDNLEEWISLLNDIHPESIKVYILCNKSDLGDSDLVEPGRTFAQEHGYKFFRTSAMNENTVQPVFQKLAEELAEELEESLVNEDRVVIPSETGRQNCC